MKAVIQKSTSHVIRNQTITVQAFYPAFGLVPPGHDSSKPWDAMPEPFIFMLRDLYILKFLLSQDEARSLFTDVGRAKGFSLSLDKSDANGLYVCGRADDTGKIPDIERWEPNCRRELEILCDTIAVKRINTVAECFTEIRKEAENIIPRDSDIIWEVDEQQSLMVLVGWEPDMMQVTGNLDAMVKQVEDHLTRQSKVVEDKITLKHYQVILIRAKKYEDDFHQKFPKLEIKLSSTSLTLAGLPDEVKSAKIHLYENITQQMKPHRWTVSQQRLKLSQKKEVRSFIISEFTKVKPRITMAWESSGSELMLHAMSSGELQQGQTIMQNAIVETSIKLQDENIPVLQCQAWKDLKQKLLIDLGDVFILEEDVAGQVINIAVSSHVCDGMLEEIRNCLDDHSVLELPLDLESPVLALLATYYKSDIDKITQQFKQFMVTIVCTEAGYIVKGTKHGVPPTLNALQDLCGKVISADHDIDRPGMNKYFNSKKGRDAVKAAQDTYRAICVDPKTIVKPVALPPPTNVSIFATKSKELYTTAIRGATIRVFSGDITKHNVDVIVNAANGGLMHAGGLAAAISKAGKLC